MAPRTTPSLDPAQDDRRAPPPAVDFGRLGVYAALGASTGAVPLPWLPDWLASRIRGALVHDIASRRGVALSPDARSALADALALDAPRGLAVNALRFVGSTIAVRTLTRLGPAAMIWPLSGALRVYALGRLLDRYLEKHRGVGAGRMEVVEARRVRRAIDAALTHALRVTPEAEVAPPLVEDARDSATAFLDSVLGFAAGLPSRFVRHIDAAFDETIHDARG